MTTTFGSSDQDFLDTQEVVLNRDGAWAVPRLCTSESSSSRQLIFDDLVQVTSQSIHSQMCTVATHARRNANT